LKKAVSHSLVKRDGFHIQPIDLAVRAPALQADRDRDIEYYRHIGLQPRRRQAVEPAQRWEIQPPPVPLVRQRGVGESIAQDNHTGGQRGPDHFLDMLSAGCHDEEGFGERGQLFIPSVQHDISDLLRNRCAARFACLDHGPT
jgi:hypothetical protein